MATVSRGEITITNVNDGKPSYTHQAYAWSADGKDRFTSSYPSKNDLILKRITEGESANTILPIHEKSTNSSGALVRVLASNTDDGGYSITTTTDTGGYFRPVANIPATALGEIGDEMYISFRYSVKSGNYLRLRLINFSASDATTYYSGTGSANIPFKLREVPQVYIIFEPVSSQGDVYTAGDSFTLYDVKLSKGSALPYTSNPADDFANAYPTYAGTYTDYEPTDSEDPSKYTWQRILGESGQDGKDGEDGVNGQDAKEVISGYLSNESIIVPATAAGSVTDFSKAVGDFVVYEGQTKLSSGVTYSKVSEIGMTSTINSAGRYTVTALSSDVGTATYQAVYKDVTLQKIVIAVKNKQGPTGPKGDSTGIIAQNTVPMSPYVGMLWKNTGAIGYIDGVTYRWTGSKWEIYVLAAANIVAETLAAISANLGTVTAGIIQSTDGKTFFNLTEGTFKLGEKFIYDGNKLTVRGEINADADVWLYNSDFADRNAGLHFRFVDSGAGGKLNAIYLGYNPDMISTGYSRYYIGSPDAVASQVIVGGTFTAGSAVETPIVRTTSHIATPKINLGTSSSLEQGVVRLRPQTSAAAYMDFYDQTKQSVRLVQDSDNKFKIVATYDDVRIQMLGHLYVMNVAGTGYRQVKASSFDQQSSISHKYDIRDLEDGYFDRFKEIKLHSYRRSDDEKYYQLGVIYEENIDQPFTHSEKNGEGGVDLYSFITFIGKALQESINKIEVLEEKLNGYNSN